MLFKVPLEALGDEGFEKEELGLVEKERYRDDTLLRIVRIYQFDQGDTQSKCFGRRAHDDRNKLPSICLPIHLMETPPQAHTREEQHHKCHQVQPDKLANFSTRQVHFR